MSGPMRTILKTVAALALVIGCAIGLTAQQPTPLAFEGGRLLIGDGRVIENGTIIVTNGRITAIGPAAQVQRPRNATRIDATGKTIMPALVEAHMHMGYENASSWRAENYTRENVIDTLNR